MFTRRLFVGNCWGKKILRTTSIWNMEKNFGIYRYLLPYFREISQYFLPGQATHDAKSVQTFFLKKNIRWYLVIWSRFAGKCGIFQSGSKIVDLGFVKFKSNGTKAKRLLEQIHKTQWGKKKQFFFVFLGGFARIFSEIKRGWIFPEIKWGMDFLGNQMGWIFLGIKREFKKKKINKSWEQFSST